MPVTLQPKSEPEPDIALVLPPQLRYRNHHPSESEIFLVIEVADSTLSSDPPRVVAFHDHQIKSVMYAKAGIADYWIIDVKSSRLFVLRNPAGEIYLQEVELGRSDHISPLAFPNITISVAELLP